MEQKTTGEGRAKSARKWFLKGPSWKIGQRKETLREAKRDRRGSKRKERKERKKRKRKKKGESERERRIITGIRNMLEKKLKGG